MFCDGNGVYWAKEECLFGPDSFYYDDLDAANWAGFTQWSDADFNAKIDAREAWHGMRRLEQPPAFRRWQAVGDAYRGQEYAQWCERLDERQEQRQQQRQEQQQQEEQQRQPSPVAGGASKKQKH